jgi:hypothetical protein
MIVMSKYGKMPVKLKGGYCIRTALPGDRADVLAAGYFR